MPILAEDPDYKTNGKRVENRKELLTILSDRYVLDIDVKRGNYSAYPHIQK